MIGHVDNTAFIEKINTEKRVQILKFESELEANKFVELNGGMTTWQKMPNGSKIWYVVPSSATNIILPATED